MITIVFGNPGCGKTTDAVKRAIKSKSKYKFCNFEQSAKGVSGCDLTDLGKWTFPPDSEIFVDEAGIEYNNRAYKSFPKEAIRWYKKHRHYECDITIYSQDIDMDISLQRLAVEYWLMYQIGPWSLSRRIYKRIGIDKNTEQITAKYKFASLLWLLVFPIQFITKDYKYRLTFRPFYYKYFDSWEKDDIPIKYFDYVDQLF